MPGNGAPLVVGSGSWGPLVPSQELSTPPLAWGHFFKNAQGPSSFLQIYSSDFSRGQESASVKGTGSNFLFCLPFPHRCCRGNQGDGTLGKDRLSLAGWPGSKDGETGERGVLPYLYFPLGAQGLDVQ